MKIILQKYLYRNEIHIKFRPKTDKQSKISKFEKGFSILVLFSVLLVLYFLVLDMFLDTSNIQDIIFYSDIGITIIFLIDLIFLYKRSHGFWDFLKKNWLDVISVIPFGMAFRLTKLVRVLRIFRIFSRASKATKISKAAKISKISKGLRLKSEVPRTGKILSKMSKKKDDKK